MTRPLLRVLRGAIDLARGGQRALLGLLGFRRRWVTLPPSARAWYAAALAGPAHQVVCPRSFSHTPFLDRAPAVGRLLRAWARQRLPEADGGGQGARP